MAQKSVTLRKNEAETEKVGKKPIDNQAISTYSEINNNNPALNETEQAVLAQLTQDPQELAELIAKLDMPSGTVLSVLTMLTIKGLVRKHPGGRISLK